MGDVERDALDDLRALKRRFDHGALVMLHHAEGEQRADLLDDLAADLCAVAVSAAHAGAACRAGARR